MNKKKAFEAAQKPEIFGLTHTHTHTQTHTHSHTHSHTHTHTFTYIHTPSSHTLTHTHTYILTSYFDIVVIILSLFRRAGRSGSGSGT